MKYKHSILPLEMSLAFSYFPSKAICSTWRESRSISKYNIQTIVLFDKKNTKKFSFFLSPLAESGEKPLFVPSK